MLPVPVKFAPPESWDRTQAMCRVRPWIVSPLAKGTVSSLSVMCPQVSPVVTPDLQIDMPIGESLVPAMVVGAPCGRR